MSTRVVDRIDDWGGRSFGGGYSALRDLADRGFSGVVRAGGAELYMTKGVVVGVRQGSIEDFADTQGTAFEAPSPALPLLAVMQERGGEVRDQFYSEKTSIAEADRTLSEGGFTGYIELSENVLSGDYYLVYQAGRSMSVGFVGESARLIDDDEAFETADDEVGIYKVYAVDVEPIEIPDRGTGATGTDAATEADSTAGTGADASSDTGRTEAGAAETGGERRTGSADQPREDAATGEGRDAGQTASSQESGVGGASHGDPTAAAGERREGSWTADSPAQPEGASEPGRSEPGEQPRRSGTDSGGQPQHGGDGQPDGSTGWDQEAARGRTSQGSGPAGAEEALDLEQRAIPSLDPDLTAHSNGGTAPDTPEQSRGRDAGGAASRQPGGDRSEPEQHPSQPRGQPADQDPRAEATPQQPRETRQDATQQPSGPSESTREARRESPGATPQETTQPAGESPSAPAVDPERIETREAELEKREAEIRRLEDDLASATSERDDLREELAAVREERDELAAEVERLEGELARLEEELGAATEAERRITGKEALAGTDIFVRYHSKGDATLEKAHGSSTRKDEVNDNLRLEKHTQFDTETVAVGAQSYSEYIEGTVEYQFVEWLVRQLLFEIRETGHEKALKNLYDVLPAVDRAELAGVVEVVYTTDGQETRSEEAFDIILRDRMGNPLLVANLNDSREAATEPMMEDLITAAERVGQTAEQFAGAFLVTRSFFDPGALEVAEGATRGGLLSRDKRKSFVNISRKRGYHLCLVEARNENFHLAVPEL